MLTCRFCWLVMLSQRIMHVLEYRHRLSARPRKTSRIESECVTELDDGDDTARVRREGTELEPGGQHRRRGWYTDGNYDDNGVSSAGYSEDEDE